MSCCCHYKTTSAGRFFSWFARSYLKRYQKKGLEKCQVQLVNGLKLSGIENTRLLEIGCGIGYLHQLLIKDGASAAIGVDLSPRMIEEAKKLAIDMHMVDRTDYHIGDFNEIVDNIGEVDVTILDKVVCCYPDARSLIDNALSKTTRVIALTYPRPHLLNRIGVTVMTWVTWLFRIGFQNFIHQPEDLDRWINDQGFVKRFEDKTLMWLTQIYVIES